MRQLGQENSYTVLITYRWCEFGTINQRVVMVKAQLFLYRGLHCVSAVFENCPQMTTGGTLAFPYVSTRGQYKFLEIFSGCESKQRAWLRIKSHSRVVSTFRALQAKLLFHMPSTWNQNDIFGSPKTWPQAHSKVYRPHEIPREPGLSFRLVIKLLK